MAIRTNPRTLIDGDSDAAVNAAYPDDLQKIPPLTANTDIFITECNTLNRISQILNNTSVCVGVLNSGNTFSSLTQNVNAIGFDQNNNFNVVSVGNGVVKVSGGATPGGDNTQVQYNNNGAFSGDSGFTWNNITKHLNIANSIGSAGTFCLLSNEKAWKFDNNGKLTLPTIQGLNPTFVKDHIPLGSIHEKFEVTSNTTIDVSQSSLFYYSSGMPSDFTLNIVNLDLSPGFGTNILLMLNQGAAAGVPNVVTINGVSVNVKYPGGEAIEGTINSIDIVNISIFRIDIDTYLALAQVISFE
jgi:hypothetical protein